MYYPMVLIANELTRMQSKLEDPVVFYVPFEVLYA